MKLGKRAVEMLATWFGLGNSPKMPGTVGTLGAIPLVLLLSLFRNDNIFFLFFTNII